MKSHELLEAIGEAQDEFILDAKLPHRKRIPAWVKATAVAACLCLILSMAWFSKTPYASYTAQDIADLFPATKDYNSTNAYTKVYVPGGEYLQLRAIPQSESLPIYRYDDSNAVALTQKKLQTFIARNLSKYCSAMGISVPEQELADGKNYWNVTTQDNRYYFSVWSTPVWTSFSIRATFKTDDPTIRLNGHAVQVDQRQSDQQILASLEEVKAQLFDIYGVSFSDAKVARDYDGHNDSGVSYLTVYYYDADAHPLNDVSTYPVSDNIRIYFDNMRNFDGDFVSDTILSFAKIEYTDYNLTPEALYPKIANGKMISLAEAEALLYKGYVFGGHSCPLCMAAQEQISFENYDYVSFEYVYGYTKSGKIGDIVPFYAFYKAIGTMENGSIIYAKTLVPAIEVSGMEDYFRSQQQSHRS